MDIALGVSEWDFGRRGCKEGMCSPLAPPPIERAKLQQPVEPPQLLPSPLAPPPIERAKLPQPIEPPQLQPSPLAPPPIERAQLPQLIEPPQLLPSPLASPPVERPHRGPAPAPHQLRATGAPIVMMHYHEKIDDDNFKRLLPIQREPGEKEREEKKIIEALCFSISYINFCMRCTPIGWITRKINPYFLMQYLIHRLCCGHEIILGLQLLIAFLVPLAFQKYQKRTQVGKESLTPWVLIFTFSVYATVKIVGKKFPGTWQARLELYLVAFGEMTIPSAFYCGVGDFCGRNSSAQVFQPFIREEKEITKEKPDLLGPIDHILIAMATSFGAFGFFATAHGGVAGVTLALSFGPGMFKFTDLLYAKLFALKPIVDAQFVNYRVDRDWVTTTSKIKEECRELIQNKCKEAADWYDGKEGKESIRNEIRAHGEKLLIGMLTFLAEEHNKNQMQSIHACCLDLFRARDSFATSKVALYCLGLIDIFAFLVAYFDPEDMMPFRADAIDEKGRSGRGCKFFLTKISIVPLPAVTCKLNGRCCRSRAEGGVWVIDKDAYALTTVATSTTDALCYQSLS